ncbi:MAG: S41 family peptidase [Treponemataceae bacterium]
MADYEYFWDFIYNDYPFTEVCERKGADLQKIKEEGAKKLLLKFYTVDNYYNFYLNLCSRITSFAYTGHLYPIEYTEYNYLFKNDAYYHKFYDMGLIDSFYKTKLKNISAYPPQQAGKLGYGGDVKAETSILEPGKIAYVRIDSFWIEQFSDSYERYKKDMKKFFLDTADYKHIIIDVSQNGGGFRRCYKDDIIAYHIKNTLEYKNYRLYSENWYTDLYTARGKNVVDIKEVPNVKNAGTQRHTKALCETFSINPDRLDREYTPAKDRKFWVLISGQTASAADSFAGFCKGTGFATVVGENSGGLGHNRLDSSSYAMLPKSGLLIRFDSLYGLNSEGYCVDEVGTAPDIYNLPGKDALETCLEEIKKLDGGK